MIINVIGYIYKTTNLVNSKIYIGQHTANQFEPEKYIGSGVLLKKAITKYGINNFSCKLLAWAETIEELNKLEIFYIKKYNSMNPKIGYNLCPGGETNYGYVFTDEQREHQRLTHLNKKPSDEAIKKQAKKLKGRITITDGQHIKLINPNEFDNYKKLGWQKGRPKYSRSQEVICYETGEVFSSMNSVLLKYPKAGALKRCVKSKYDSTCCGYHWYLSTDLVRKAWLEKNINK